MIALAAIFGALIIVIVSFGTCRTAQPGFGARPGGEPPKSPPSKMDLAVRDLARERNPSAPPDGVVSRGGP